MDIKGKAIRAILTKMAIIAIMEAVSNGHNYGLYVCLMKEWSKCSSPVKAILEDMYNLSKVIGGNKKSNETSIFWAIFPHKIGQILELMALNNESLLTPEFFFWCLLTYRHSHKPMMGLIWTTFYFLGHPIDPPFKMMIFCLL